MTTKIDLSKLMTTQDDAEKRPLFADKMADEERCCHSPTPSRGSSSSSSSSPRKATTDSHPLLSWLVLIALLVVTMYGIYRLEMRVRRLEVLCDDLTNNIVSRVVASDSATAPTLRPEHATVEASFKSSSAAAAAAEKTDSSSPSSPLLYVEGEDASVGVQTVEELDVGLEGSGQDSIGLGDTENGNADYDFDVDALLAASEDDGDGWSGYGPQASDDLLDSYVGLFGLDDKVSQLDDVAADFLHARKRRSAATDDSAASDNNDAAMADERTAAADDSDALMLADAAQVKLAGRPKSADVRDGDASGSTTRRKSRLQTTDRPSGKRQSTSNKRPPSQSSGIKVAHFVAPKQDSHYVSNTQPPVTFPFWQADNWTMSMGSQNTFFDLSDGEVIVLESGVYMIYAQIEYHDTSGRWAFGIYVDDNERLKCMNSEQLRQHRGSGDDAGISSDGSVGTSALHSVYQHCYTSGLLKLRRLDKISLRCLYGNRAIVMQPGFTFWGLVKLVSIAD